LTNAVLCSMVYYMDMIKKAIEDELKRRGWSRYRLTKELEGKMPARTVYAYLSGERDLSSERVSKIMEKLGLGIKKHKFKRRPKK